MDRGQSIRVLFFAGLAAVSCGSAFAASLELGHVRANRRGWADPELKDVSHEVQVEMPEVTEAELTEEFVAPPEEEMVAEFSEEVEIAELPESPSEVAKTDAPWRKRLGTGFRKAKNGLILIGVREKKPDLRHGYLTVEAPPALRFSDVDPINSRPPAPALPEFSFVSDEYFPYLIESELSEDALNDAAMLSEIVIELAPHEIVSGIIDTRRTSDEELVEHFDLDEQGSTSIRPEEVLIFFETDTGTTNTGAMVPFSPATPTNTTIESSANLRKE